MANIIHPCKIYHLPDGWYWIWTYGPGPNDFEGPYGPFPTEKAAKQNIKETK